MAGFFTPWIVPSEGVEGVYWNITHPLQAAITEIEHNGVCVDKEYLLELAADYSHRIIEKENDFYSTAGRIVRYTAADDLASFLYGELKLPVLKETPTGKPSTAIPVLEKLADEHPAVAKLVDLKRTVKTKKDFLDGYGPNSQGLLPFIRYDGRIHSNYRIDGTDSGRLSSFSPNLQNISKLEELRKMFRPAKGHKMIEADYSQMELRIAAILARDSAMMAAFASGLDFHTVTAAMMFHCTPDEVTSDQRRKAKAINFGVLYGMGPGSLAFRLDITFEEAESYINAWFAGYKGVYRWLRDNGRFAREHGYIANPLGRRRRFPELLMEATHDATWRIRTGRLIRIANNFPIQSTGSDLLSLSTISLINYPVDEFVATGARPIMSLHDALYFEVPEENAHAAGNIIREVMEAIPQEVLGRKWVIPADVKIMDFWTTKEEYAETLARAA